MLLRLRARTRALILMVVTTAVFSAFLCLSSWWNRPAYPVTPPPQVLEAAASKIPRNAIESVRFELFNGCSAWEVRGMDGKGVVWQLDITDDGEVLMYEPIVSYPPPDR